MQVFDKKEYSRMIGFLKYRADPGKSKSGDMLEEAQFALEVVFVFLYFLL